MTMRDSIFPQWVEGRFVTDAALQRAYERVPAERRSWLKTCIAQLHAFLGQNDTAFRLVAESRTQGYSSQTAVRPMSWSLVLLDGAMASGPRCLAALLPPILAGVEDVLVLRSAPSRDAWPAPMLAGVELAGAERCAQLGRRELNDLLRHVAAPEQAVHGPGVIVMPQPVSQLQRDVQVLLAEAPHCVLWHSGWSGEIGLYHGADDDWDVEALAWSHPDATFHCHGAGLSESSLPQGWRPESPDRAGFLAKRYPWAVAPMELHGEFLRHSALALGEGEEGCWLWPGLRPELFLRHAAGLSRTGQGTTVLDHHEAAPIQEERA